MMDEFGLGQYLIANVCISDVEPHSPPSGLTNLETFCRSFV
jgi:hypothetical protein